MNAMTQVTVIDMAIPTIQSFVKIYSLIEMVIAAMKKRENEKQFISYLKGRQNKNWKKILTLLGRKFRFLPLSHSY